MSESKASLTIVIPTYNEEFRLPPTLAILADWIPRSCFDVEVIVVDDGSQDLTQEVATGFKDRLNLQIIQVPHVGYMNAIITGLKASTRPLRATLEADCPVHPEMFERFAAMMTDYDIVMGSRVLKGEDASVEGKSFYRRFLSGGMTRLYTLLFKGGIHDPQIGFKLYRGVVLDRILPRLALRHDGLKSAEILVKALAFGYRVKEVPVRYKHDEDSRCVPKGNRRVVIQAAQALGELWVQSYVEYRQGRLPGNPVRGGFLLAPFWRSFNFPALTQIPLAPAGQP